MPLLPASLAGKIQFCESHLPLWLTNAVAIGSSAAEITALQAKTVAARAALTAQETARDTAVTKTAELREAVDAMAQATSDLVKKIRAKAATGGDVIYNLANIPAPASPSHRGRPGTPFDFKVTLDPNGMLVMTWKCNNPAGTTGTIYNVFRRVGAEGELVFVGGNGLKMFADNTIPAGATRLTYQVQAVRSNAVGVFGEFNVNFGSNAGTTTATIVETPARLAA